MGEGKNISPMMRTEVILEHLKNYDSISTQKIARKVNVPGITICRELSKLEEKGLLIRTRNGIMKSSTTENLFTYDDKINQHREEKDHICQIAAGFIVPGDVIFIDCGSTLSLLVSYIRKIESLTVITNSLPIASELINYNNIKLILIGGEVDNERKAIYGYSAMNNITQYHANKAFIGADGISLSYGVTSHSEQSASLTFKMMENSDEVFLLCDSSKIEKSSFIKFAPLSMIDYVITDQKVDHMLIFKYGEYDVNLICKGKITDISDETHIHDNIY